MWVERRRGRPGRGRRARQGPARRHPRHRQPGRRRALPGHPAHAAAAAPGPEPPRAEVGAAATWAVDASSVSSGRVRERPDLGRIHAPSPCRPVHPRPGPAGLAAGRSAAGRAAAGRRRLPARGRGDQRARSRPSRRPPIGRGGGVTSVDADASRIGLRVLRRGGNAVDAAVATAAALGVTEPYSAGVGGGGYFVHYDASTGRVQHHRRPRDRAARDPARRVHRPGHRRALPVHPRPGHQRRLGRRPRHPRHLAHRPAPLGHPLAGAGPRAERPPRRARASWSTRPSAPRPTTTASGSRPSPAPSGSTCAAARCPRVGTRFRNPDLARTYRALGRDPELFYRGALAARDRPRRAPPTDAAAAPTCRSRRGYADPRATSRATAPRSRRPTHVRYRGLEVVGMRAVLQRRHHRRRGAQHPRALRPRRAVRGRLPAPLPRGQRPGLRRPRRLRRRRPLRRRARSAPCSTSASPTSGPARSTPTPPRPSRSRPATSPTTTASAAPRAPGPTSPEDTRERLHHPPHGRRPLGQRRRPTRSPSSRPAARASSCPAAASCSTTSSPTSASTTTPPTPTGSQPRQAAAQLDVADARAARRQAVPRARLAGRLDDHHDRPAGAAQPPRPRHDAARGGRRAAGLAAQHRDRERRARVHRRATTPCSSPTATTLVPSGDAFTSAAEIGAATGIEFGPRRPADRRRRAEAPRRRVRAGRRAASDATRTAATRATPYRGRVTSTADGDLDRDHRRRRRSVALLGEPTPAGPRQGSYRAARRRPATGWRPRRSA